MSSAGPSRVNKFRRRITFLIALVLLPISLYLLVTGVNDLRERELVSEIEAGHGTVVRETSEWDRWMGEMVDAKSGIRMYRSTDGAIVRLDGNVFDNVWIRDHDYLKALPISTLTLNKANISGTDLAQLVGSHPLRELYAAEVEVSPEVLEGILQQQRLKLLHLRGCKFEDQQFVRLPLEQMEQIYIEQTQVTPQGLQDLQRCSRLSYLGIDGHQLNDGTATLLAAMPNLRMLNVVGAEVTDAHIRRLHGMQQLNQVMLVQTSATAEGMAALRSSIPGCIVLAY